MLQIDDHDRVRVLTFDRPDALNAMSNALYRATAEALDAAAEEPRVGVVVLTGGGRAFCAGQDLNEMGPPPEGETVGFPVFMDALVRFPKPIIAAVNGLAVGVGFTMLPHCDLVLVADSARFRTPFAQLGVVPEAASSVLFPMAMGWQRAAYSLLTGEWIGAAEMVASGLALESVPTDRLLEETMTIAKKIAALPVTSLVETKRLMRADRDALVAAARAREDDAFARMVGAPANREAIAAFLEKREPDFSSLPVD